MSNLTQPEGSVTGMGAKMFTVAGPVITPSARKSMAGDTTEFAKPVMGTRVPAPPKRPSLL